MKKIIWRKTQR